MCKDMANNNNNLLRLLVLGALGCLLFANLAHTQWSTEGDEDECTTPEGDSSVCQRIHECKALDAIWSDENLFNQLKPYLKKLICGDQKICCPKRNLLALLSNDPAPPDVSNHRNYDLLPRECGYLDTGDKIVNGNVTVLFEYPWMALLAYRPQNGNEYLCGGTIINERYIMTAAHCVHNRQDLTRIRVGDYDYNKDPDCEPAEDSEDPPVCSPPYVDLGIEKVIVHPGYSRTKVVNDIALLRVNRKIRFNNKNIRPVCLPVQSARNYNFTNRNLIVTGWGMTEKGPSSSVLLKAEVPFVPMSECKKSIEAVKIRNVQLDYRQICAGRTRSDSCRGDSGGPLHAVSRVNGDSRYVQQGIVSVGPSACGSEIIPAIYTKVAFYMDWILDQIKP